MSLLTRMAISNGNSSTKELATAVITSIDQKKIDHWNKALVVEIERKAGCQTKGRQVSFNG